MYELKRKIGVLLGDKKETIKKLKIMRKVLALINLKHSEKGNIVVQNHGVDALKILYREARKENVHLWLDFGTLLGWYREKKFISFDVDLDVGAYFEDYDKFKVMQKRLLESGFVYTRRFEYDGDVVEESYSYKGLNIDIVFYNKTVNYKNIMSYLIVYAMDLNQNPVDIKGYYESNRITALKVTQFMDVEVEVPVNTEEYLQNYYGEDFMTPIPNYDWKASGLYPEMKDSSKCKAIVYGGKKSEK